MASTSGTDLGQAMKSSLQQGAIMVGDDTERRYSIQTMRDFGFTIAKRDVEAGTMPRLFSSLWRHGPRGKTKPVPAEVTDVICWVLEHKSLLNAPVSHARLQVSKEVISHMDSTIDTAGKTKFVELIKEREAEKPDESVKQEQDRKLAKKRRWAYWGLSLLCLLLLVVITFPVGGRIKDRLLTAVTVLMTEMYALKAAKFAARTFPIGKRLRWVLVISDTVLVTALTCGALAACAWAAWDHKLAGEASYSAVLRVALSVGMLAGNLALEMEESMVQVDAGRWTIGNRVPGLVFAFILYSILVALFIAGGRYDIWGLLWITIALSVPFVGARIVLLVSDPKFLG